MNNSEELKQCGENENVKSINIKNQLFLCNICNEILKRNFNLKSHIVTAHENERPFYRNICDYLDYCDYL